jgi:putative addiction module killer protein
MFPWMNRRHSLSLHFVSFFLVNDNPRLLLGGQFSPLTNGNRFVTIHSWMIEVRGYVDDRGSERFARWFAELDPHAAAKVTIACARLEQGNFSNMKSVGAGVYEYKIDFGPGYRIYFAKDGDRLVILIGGGTKKRQAKDVASAKECWTDYKRRKKQEPQ